MGISRAFCGFSRVSVDFSVFRVVDRGFQVASRDSTGVRELGFGGILYYTCNKEPPKIV